MFSDIEITRCDLCQADCPVIKERKLKFGDGSDYMQDMEEMEFNDIRIAFGRYKALKKQRIRVVSKSDYVISHFSFAGTTQTNCGIKHTIADNEFSLFYQKENEIEHYIAPTGEKEGSFFDLSIPKSYFDKLFLSEGRFISEFLDKTEQGKDVWVGKNLNISPAMLSLIYNLFEKKYKGNLRRIYLESKIVELLVMQIGALEDSAALCPKFKKHDMDCLYAAKSYLETHLNENCSIVDLSRRVGINQTTLKSGFKSLFGNTIFGYLTDLRMEKAKYLLLDKKMYINEVSDLVGYRHPNHFAIAFRRKYGYLPSALKQ